MQSKQIIIKNHLISYYTEGEGDQTILFLHGWRSEAAVWNSIIPQIQNSPPQTGQARFKIQAIDLPGFGKSQAPQHTFTLQDYANIVEEYITKLDLHKIILVGHSFGARIAAKLAAAHPELIEKLVLIDSGGARPVSKDVKQTVAKLAKPFFKPSFMQPLRKKIYKHIGAEDYVATPELKETFVNIINEDLGLLFHKITTPTLIVWGENDEETPLSYARMMQKKIPHAHLATLENAGHFSFLDNPEEFLKTFKNFL